MSSNRLVVEAFLEARGFERGIDSILDNLDRLSKSFDDKTIGKHFQTLGEYAIQTEERVEFLTQAILDLNKAKAAMQGMDAKARNPERMLGPEAQSLLLGAKGQSVKTGTEAQISDALSRANVEAEHLKGRLVEAHHGLQLFIGTTGEVAEEFKQINQEADALAQQLGGMGKVANNALKDAAAGISRMIGAEITALQDQLLAMEKASMGQLDNRSQISLSKTPALLDAANRHRERALQLDKEILRVEEQIARGTTGRSDATKQLAQLEKLRAQRLLELQKEQSKRTEAAVPLQQGDAVRTLAGMDEAYEKVVGRIAELVELQSQLGDPDSLTQYNSEIYDIAERMAEIVAQSKLATTTDAERVELLKQMNVEMEKMQRAQKRAAQNATAGRERLDPKEFQRAIESQMPGINKLFNSVFHDMSRRFVATLQFAISGALIFGAQKFIREFLSAAVDVQRAFADIESALEFDIVEERGTAEFNRQVEEVRQEVLLLARDFNVLPVDANKAAFVMVARFSNVENALKATRAQLLATKISTIDQSEVLRALTAVSETFAGSIFDVGSALTVQEKLLIRETDAANTYGRALDYAVRIQQEFGVEVEDSLEGTARAAEAFRQMGFSLEETNAVVAATSRQLGQEGGQAAERLVRSLGQLTDPAIRDALLDIAATSDTFSLNIADFASGAAAWEKIADQFERIERTDPIAAQKILQTIGQRREVEAVAAALGTRDVQREMVDALGSAAGAAEGRFRFLEVTVGEMMASIAGGFQELAQNFERLGGISSIGVLLSVFDKIIAGVNDLLELVIDLKNSLDSLVGIPLGSIVVKFVSLSVALAGALRIALALKETFVAMAATNIFKNLSKFFAVQGGVSPLMVGRVAALDAGAAGAGMAGKTMAGLGAGAAAATKSIGAMAASALASVPVWGWIAAAVIGTILVFKSMNDHAKALERSLQETEKAITESRRVARAELRHEGIDPNSEEGRLRLLEAELETLRDRITQAPSEGGFMKKFVRSFVGSFSGDFRDLDAHEIEGSKENMQRRAADLNATLEKALIQQFIEEVNNLETPSGLTPQQRDDIGRVVGRRIGGNENPLEIAQTFLTDALTEAYAMYADTTGSFEDQMARHADADRMVAEATADYDAVLEAYGSLPSQLNFSMNLLRKELAGLDTRVGLGEISSQTAVDERLRIAKEMKKIASDAPDSADSEQYEADAREATLQAWRAEGELLRSEAASRSAFMGDREKRRAEYRALAEEQSRYMRRTGGKEDPVINAKLRALAAQDVADINQERLDVIRHEMAMARSYEEKRAANMRLIAELESQNRRRERLPSADASGMKDTGRDIEAAKLDQELADLEEHIKRTTAAIRMAAPALSSRAATQAQLAAINIRIAAEKDYATKQVMLQERREILAKAQEAELDRLTAMKMSYVLASDAMTQQLVALSALRQQLVLAGQLYGKTSLEWYNVALSIKQAEAQIRQMVLEVESVNRQLATGFDVTNPLHAAEEAYIKAVRALQIPDLGEAERAAAELNRRNAEAALEAASFSEGMFDLKFQFESGAISQESYIAALRGMLAAVDTSTHQGKEIWLQINALIEGMTDDIKNQAFNIPGQIRLPTLFEVRRAVQADSMGVNYLDNRQQDINVYVTSAVQLDALFQSIAGAFEVEDARFAPGGAGITLGMG